MVIFSGRVHGTSTAKIKKTKHRYDSTFSKIGRLLGFGRVYVSYTQC